MQLTFLGAAHSVTGSRYLVQYDSKKFLVDCGLFQGFKELRLRNWAALQVNPKDLEMVILTHAHVDHSGYLPLLVKNGFTGKIYCSYGTQDLCSILLPDSGFLQEEDAKRANKYGYSKHKPALPLYTEQDACACLSQFVPIDFNQPHQLFGDLSFELKPAGHIIGASIVSLTHGQQSIVFSGDLGRPHDPIMKPPVNIDSADYLILESTYGDRLHNRSDPLDQLASVIQKTAERGGTVVIPAFAVGRAQMMLYYLYLLKQAHRIPDLPIFLDSPMAQDASDLLSHYAGEHRLSEKLSHDICKIARYVKTQEDSKAIDQQKVPSIIISASGMAEGGRVLHHLKIFLPNHLNTILFTGYQDGGTRGDRLLRGETEIKIHGEMIPVQAQIVSMSNVSAHADYEEIMTWLKNFKHPPKKTFLTHGSLANAEALKARIEQELHWDCVIPEYLQKFEL